MKAILGIIHLFPCPTPFPLSYAFSFVITAIFYSFAGDVGPFGAVFVNGTTPEQQSPFKFQDRSLVVSGRTVRFEVCMSLFVCH
jgi:hypothetical protein